MRKTIIVILILVVIIGAGAGIWYYYANKKSSEGGKCVNSNKCETGLACVNSKCSSGRKDSPCNSKSDCQTAFCAKNLCTEGEIGDICATYKDCQTGLLCKNSVCSKEPEYSKYFDSITISKIKPGMPPGPNNIPVETTEFKASSDAIEVDLAVKQGVKGTFYAEVIDPITGESVFRNETQEITQAGDRGTGFALPSGTKAGEYELDIYFNDELVYTTTIKVIE